jgi:flagellin-like hook-associated protein FlgL
MSSDGAVAVTGNTVVQVTMKQLYISIASLLGGLAVICSVGIAGAWAIIGGIREDVKISMAGLRDDVKEIRTSVQGLQTTNADLGTKIAVLNTSVANLSAKIDDVQKQPSFFTDPKFAAALADQLKKAGLDDQKIIILPLIGPFPR